MGLIKLNGVNYWGSNYGAGILAQMIYSDEEREVGVWRDNKPLYQKTAYISNVSILANSSTNVNISDYFSDVDSAVDYECCDENGNSIFPNIMVNNGLSPYSIGVTVDKSSDHIVFTRGSGSNATISVRFTLRYTKTTDVAGSGDYTTLGIPTVHYDGNEKVIGTWFGETLYECTVDIGAMTQDTNWHRVSHGIANIQSIVDVKVLAHSTNADDEFIPIPIYRPTSTYGIVFTADKTTFNYLNNWQGSIDHTYVTVQYTKS